MKTKNSKGEWVNNNSWYDPHVIEGEVNEEPSLTQPSLSYSVSEILEKHVRGINLPVYKPAVYENGSIDSPDMTKIIDVTEAEEMRAEVTSRINKNLKRKEVVQEKVVETEEKVETEKKEVTAKKQGEE